MAHNNLDGVGFSFDEPMYGWFAMGETDPAQGAAAGERARSDLRFDVRIHTPDLARFLRDPQHGASLAGSVTVGVLGGVLPIRDGAFQLFSHDPQTGMRRMVYRFRFTGCDGNTYLLLGHKEIRHDAGRADVLEDMTTLFTRLHRGDDESAPVVGAGILRFHMTDALALVASMRPAGARNWLQEVAARVAFTSFLWGEIRDEYLRGLDLLYTTQYDNLVLAGRMQDGARFFFVSGAHDSGFPWGDGELFWDVLLAVESADGSWERYAVTDRVLEGLSLDLKDGTYRYRGPVHAIVSGNTASFSQMRRDAEHLAPCEAEIDIEFDARTYETVAFPFPLLDPVVQRMSSDLTAELASLLPGETPLGIHITPATVRPISGHIVVRGGPFGERDWRIAAAGTAGECEHGAFRNVKEPTLLYGYLCAVRPGTGLARVQIQSRTLRNERQDWAMDQLARWLGMAIPRIASAEIRMEGGSSRVRPLPPAGEPGERVAPFRKVGEILAVNNDHFPTAVFERRIVEVEDADGARDLALEEDMTLLRLESLNSTRRTTVAAFRDKDKLTALDRVLVATSFFALVEEKLSRSGKAREAFRIAIKPNFMFSYNRRDRTTFTDPDLVAHLVRLLRAYGFRAIQVVEAQSTYGEYFDKRSVREMAEYLGFDPEAGYEIVDMTLDADESRFLGPHLGVHPVSRAWREADFRISFAKNKTHAYSFYTLTLKNMYGALPLANKFKEYHCDRDIYHTAVEYLKAFPLDYALVDAWVSADGPFGVFADSAPNETETVIGGADPVAVDWVGASKMGIDPMVSRHMQLAVAEFGKPEIALVGDGNPYRPWLNAPALVTSLAHGVMDANHQFGNLLYSVSAEMDSERFHHTGKEWPIEVLREVTDPLRATFFVRTGEAPTWSKRLFNWVLYELSW